MYILHKLNLHTHVGRYTTHMHLNKVRGLIVCSVKHYEMHEREDVNQLLRLAKSNLKRFKLLWFQ